MVKLIKFYLKLMSSLPGEIITSMKYIFRNAESIEERVPRHRFIQQSVLELFTWFDFRTIKEYRVIYNKRYRRKTRFGEIKTNAAGYVDIYARVKDFTVSFEYDNGAVLKWKSLEKILQSDALICFGITYGPRNKNFFQNYRENLKRIQQVLKEMISDYKKAKDYDKLYYLLKKELWLGIIQSGIFEQISFDNLLEQKF